MTKYERILTEYRAKWALLNPRPERQSPNLLRDYIQFLMFLPVAVIGPVVSAFRTAGLISAHTAFEGLWPLWVETLGATFLFEWAVIAYQVERLRRKMQNEGSLGRVGTWQIWIGLVAAVGAVTVSNLVEIGVAALEKAGINVPPLLPAAAIGLFIGLGIPVMSLVAGEIVGRFVLEYQIRLAKLDAEHRTTLVYWERRFVRSWNSQKKRLLAEAAAAPQTPANFAQKEQKVADGYERCWCGALVRAQPKARSAHAKKHVNDVRRIFAANRGIGLEAVATELKAAYGQRPPREELQRLYRKYRPKDF